MRINDLEQFHSLRWVKVTYPDGTITNVLQQSFVTRWRETDEHGRMSESGMDIRWVDVPTVYHPYQPAT